MRILRDNLRKSGSVRCIVPKSLICGADGGPTEL
jgi:hypothetical protein